MLGSMGKFILGESPLRVSTANPTSADKNTVLLSTAKSSYAFSSFRSSSVNGNDKLSPSALLIGSSGTFCGE